MATPSPSGTSLQVGIVDSECLAEERRLVTVLFADLSGSTALAERLDPEDLRGILASFFNALARQIQRYDGTVDKYIGDAVMAVFGAPVAHEDDPERAIRAAVAMQNSIASLNDDLEREHGVRLALRIGINTGEVVAGLLAGDVQAAYTVVGDTVNVAQRLESVAEPGTVFVGALTHRLAHRAFDMQPLALVTVKGKSEPVPAYRVLGERDTTFDVAPGGLLGRESDLARLHDAFELALQGRGQVLTIIAEPGVGKSRLVKEFTEAINGEAASVYARCASFDQGNPYALVADVLRGLFGVVRTDSESSVRAALAAGLEAIGRPADEADVSVLLDVLGYPSRTGLDPQSRQRVLVDIVRAVVAERSRRAPLIILTEDLHWIDSASAFVIGALVAKLDNLRCLVLGTARPEWDRSWPCKRISLEPLGEEDARSLVADRLGGQVDHALVGQIIKKTGGNPFFTEEVVRSLQESGAIAKRDDAWTVESGIEVKVPETVQEVLAARLDGLSVAPRRALQTAAVIGGTFRHNVLERVSTSRTLAADLAALEAGAFIQAGSGSARTYAFRHPLIQEVAYSTLLLAQRRVLHGTVGEAIEQLYEDRAEEYVDDLAFHYGRSDNDDKALHWLVRGGERASSLFANDQALALYHSALQRATKTDARMVASDVHERIGDVLTRTGKYDQALASLRTAREQAPGCEQQRDARLHRRIGTALALKGSYLDALEAFEAGLAALGGQANLEAARLTVQLGQVQSRCGKFGDAREALSRAIEIATGLGAKDVLADGLKFLGAAVNYSGDAQAAAVFYERARVLYEKLGDIVGTCTVRMNGGLLHCRGGRWDEALAEYAEALVLAERVGNPSLIAIAHNNVGEVFFYREDYREAMAAKERALTIATSIGSESQAALARMGVGIARIRLGEVATGRADLLAAAEQFARIGHSRYESELCRCLAYADLADGDYAGAAANAARALDLARAAGSAPDEAVAQRVLGEVALARGDTRGASQLLEESRRRLAELGDIAELRRAEETLARISESLALR